MKHIGLWNTAIEYHWDHKLKMIQKRSNCINVKVSNRIIIIIATLQSILSLVFQGLRQSLTEIKKIPTEEQTITVFLQLMSHIRYWNLPNCESADFFFLFCETNNNICTCLFPHLRTSQSFGIYSIPEYYWMHLSYRLHAHLSIIKIILISVEASICACKKRKLEPKYWVDWSKVSKLQ